MSVQLLDSDAILLDNEHWTKLDKEWGTPIDLETDEDLAPSKLQSVSNTLDLKSTFNSSFLFKKIRRKVTRNISKKSLDYNSFLNDLQQEAPKEIPEKQFYFINGQILSAMSVEDICEDIDNVFSSIEKLCSATSTVRTKKIKKQSRFPDVVQCSISTGGLSFDDTLTRVSVDEINEEIVKCIDEAFQQFNTTMSSITYDDEDRTRESVTTLVQKFSNILKSPHVKCSPRRQRQCCERFKDLAEFWQKRAMEDAM